MAIVLTNSRLLELLLQYQAQFNMNGGGTFKVSHVNGELVTVHRFWEWEWIAPAPVTGPIFMHI